MYHFQNLHHTCFWKHFYPKPCLCCLRLPAETCACIHLCFVVLFQVHGLDAETWKKVDVVYIDIADRSQVESKVSMLSLKSLLRRLQQLDRLLLVSSNPCRSCWSFLYLSRTTNQRRILAGSSQWRQDEDLLDQTGRCSTVSCWWCWLNVWSHRSAW